MKTDRDIANGLILFIIRVQRYKKKLADTDTFRYKNKNGWSQK